MTHSLVYDGNKVIGCYPTSFQATIKVLMLLFRNSQKSYYLIETMRKNRIVETIKISKRGRLIVYKSQDDEVSVVCTSATMAIKKLAIVLNTDIDGYPSYYGNSSLAHKVNHIYLYELDFLTSNLRQELNAVYKDPKSRHEFSQLLKSIGAQEITAVGEFGLNVVIKFVDGTNFRFIVS